MASKFPDRFYQPPGKPPVRVRLRDSQFYKNLPPTSGRSFGERLAERYSPSPNMHDMTGAGFNRNLDPMRNPAIVGDKSPKPKPTEEKKPRVKKKPKLDDFMKKSNSKTHNNLVTPGKWETKG